MGCIAHKRGSMLSFRWRTCHDYCSTRSMSVIAARSKPVNSMNSTRLASVPAAPLTKPGRLCPQHGTRQPHRAMRLSRAALARGVQRRSPVHATFAPRVTAAIATVCGLVPLGFADQIIPTRSLYCFPIASILRFHAYLHLPDRPAAIPRRTGHPDRARGRLLAGDHRQHLLQRILIRPASCWSAYRAGPAPAAPASGTASWHAWRRP